MRGQEFYDGVEVEPRRVFVIPNFGAVRIHGSNVDVERTPKPSQSDMLFT